MYDRESALTESDGLRENRRASTGPASTIFCDRGGYVRVRRGRRAEGSRLGSNNIEIRGIHRSTLRRVIMPRFYQYPGERHTALEVRPRLERVRATDRVDIL